jgi:hypothetical protein
MMRTFAFCCVAALAGLVASACSVSNEGNVTAPPPPPSTTSTASGGSSTGGSGAGGGSVIPTGGLTGDGGPTDLSKPWKSSGCGQPKPADQKDTIPGSRTGYTERHVMQTGATLGTTDPSKAGDRQYFVRLPADYDVNKPYRVVYIGQGCGEKHAGNTATYALFDESKGGSEEAIYIGLSVPDNNANPTCFDNNDGPQSQEWEAFDLIQTQIEKTYCVDNNRIYVAGYSTGGWLSDMWACYFGGIPTPPRKFSPKWAIRGHANVTGSLPDNQPKPCGGPAAGFWIHDALDKQNQLAGNIAALDLALQTNGCTGTYADGPKEPWAPAEGITGLGGGICQDYSVSCPAAMAKNYPLIFCTTNGLGHADQSTSAIPAFTTFFNLLNPTP